MFDRRLALLAGLALLGGCASLPAPVPAAGAAAASADKLEASGFRLFELLRREAPAGENTLVSPVSVQQAMGLVHLGARGDTAAQIEAALGLPPGAAGDAALAAQRRALAGNEGETRIRLANALWLAERAAFRADYLAGAKAEYAATAARLDFAGNPKAAATRINGWAAEQTEGLIPAIVTPDSFSDATLAVLTNALFFESEWIHPFDPPSPEPFLLGSGREQPFPLMSGRSELAYAEGEGWQAVRLPYRPDGRFVMDVFVPLRRQADARLAAGTYRNLSDRLAKLPPQLVAVTLPRFEIGWKETLNPVLQALGITAAFDPARADLTGIADARGGRLAINRVSHAAKLQVFEIGTRAAAVTAVEIVTTGSRFIGPKPKVLRADQPFHVVIRDTGSGAVLFIGRIAAPDLFAGK